MRICKIPIDPRLNINIVVSVREKVEVGWKKLPERDFFIMNGIRGKWG